MCTLIVLNEFLEEYPLVIVGNRDERYDRQSSPPASQGDVICPRDIEKDGTWMGVARNGWFVGLTNQDDGKHDPDTLSRGKVVDDCLHVGTHCEAAKILKGLDLPHYNPFNIVFGRPGAMFLVRAWAGHPMEMDPLAPGINVISNDCWGHGYDIKCNWARNFASSLIDDPPISDIQSVLARLHIVMADHHNASADDPFQSLCVHAEKQAFGTRSTSLITVSKHGDVEYWYLEGHPCQSKGLTLAGRLEHR